MSEDMAREFDVSMSSLLLEQKNCKDKKTATKVKADKIAQAMAIGIFIFFLRNTSLHITV